MRGSSKKRGKAGRQGKLESGLAGNLNPSLLSAACMEGCKSAPSCALCTPLWCSDQVDPRFVMHAKADAQEKSGIDPVADESFHHTFSLGSLGNRAPPGTVSKCHPFQLN